MKTILFGLLSLACTNVFAFNFGKKDSSDFLIQYHTQEGIQKFECNYHLTAPEEKRQKLQQALRFEEAIFEQIIVESENFDRLASRNIDVAANTKKVLDLEKQLEKQRQVALELLSLREKLSEYIGWLRI